ncbi:DUF3301 domain-containing protein [Rhodocyclus tenuis]|uniref:DUF3301 domain-containing protein n=1 Tax=Rhodocyclus tenuis TaxID=1066 RepID=A0A840GBQ3_RHOTE|nr:DUF3301 domain-containing protein [Rhodocyclus tenuis]MBB4248310.1 hypothetical protein [Rhodocyclus tenuis]MBK1678972.1 hypothetical protein [Rhodocyclus tenuis]
MPWAELSALILLGGVAWLWIDTLRAREACLYEVRNACALRSLQLLDDTVAVGRMRFARDDAGRLQLQRDYVFEFSDTGNNRRRGGARLLGRELIAIDLGPRLVSVSELPID